MSMGGAEKNLNMSNFSTNPNTTATRFYNPNKQNQHGGSPHQQNNMMNETQSRFMQNLQNNRPKIQNNGGVGSSG